MTISKGIRKQFTKPEVLPLLWRHTVYVGTYANGHQTARAGTMEQAQSAHKTSGLIHSPVWVHECVAIYSGEKFIGYESSKLVWKKEKEVSL